MFKISKRGVGVLTILALTVALWGNVPVNNDTKAATATVDLNGTYHASLGIQTCTSIWYENLNYYKKTKTNVLSSSLDGDTAGTFTEATIAGNGTYTVSLTNAVFNNPNHKSTLENYAGEQHISQLHVATDIPDNETIKFTNLSVNINGTEVVKYEEAFMENESSYKANGMVAIALNKWRASKEKNTVLIEKMKQYNLVDEKDTTISLGGGYKLLNGTGEENITITFTVSGFGYNYGETPATATPQPTATAAPSSSGSGNATATVSSDTALADGATATVDNLEYTVTDSSAEGGTVSLTSGSSASGKITVPATVDWNGTSLKVTEIANNAFANNKKIKSVVIGSNVTTIGVNAFKGCSALKLINAKSDLVLKKVGKNALKGVNKKCKITVPKKKKKAYTKLFKGKGQAKTVKVK